MRQIVARIQRHLEGELQHFSGDRIDWSRVSEFQQAVYRDTQAIKPGFKKSYGDISRALALGPEGARAVGAALATNPWPLIVPCHRVVSATDRMTGFSAPGGIRTKTRLLVLEARNYCQSRPDWRVSRTASFSESRLKRHSLPAQRGPA